MVLVWIILRGYPMSYKTVTDDYINGLFADKDFGDPINECIKKKRELLLKGIRVQAQGMWSGHTLYHILIEGLFIKDGKTGEPKPITPMGLDFLQNNGDLNSP